MKLIHLSDLHLGKRVNEFSMLEDQKYILKKILSAVDAERPDAVLIAGDLYDKPLPPAEAVTLLDDFLYALSGLVPGIFIISGNHDSPERIAFGARLLERSGIHLSPVYDGNIVPVSLEDSFGTVDFYLLPFVKPANVRRFYPDEKTDTYTDALRTAVSHMQVNPAHRNVLVTHQFVTGASRSESEEISVGGTDNVDASVFDGFDYTALGHLHGPQNIGTETVRYCGTPLKYSFSEEKQEKSLTVVELGEKGTVSVRTVPLTPLHDLRSIRGTYLAVTARSFYEGTDTEDYLHVTLTDEEDIPDAIAKLRVIYPNIMRLDYDNTRTRAGFAAGTAERVAEKTPDELFAEFFERQNSHPMSEMQTKIVSSIMKEIWEDGR